MHPILYEGGGLTIHTYGFAVAVALFGGILASVRLGASAGVPASWMWDAGLITLFGAAVGSRLEYVRTHWEAFAAHPGRAFGFSDGGLVFYGGLVFTALCLLVYAAWRRIDPRRLLDPLATALPFGHAIGRLGCFAAGCCYGKPTDGPFGVVFVAGASAEAGVAVHPAQLYEAGLDVVLGLVLATVWAVGGAGGEAGSTPARPAGRQLGLLLVSYPLVRLVVEQLRGDAERGVALFGLTNGELTSVALLVAGIAVLATSRRA